MFTLTKQTQDIDMAGQAGVVSVQSRTAIPFIEITRDMIDEAAYIIEESPFCEIGPASAANLAEEILSRVLSLARIQTES